MPDKKLTDSEIIRIMEICVNKTDVFVIHHNAETREYDQITLKDILGVINRLYAENERLKTNLNIDLENFATEYDNKIKAEAYKEFAESSVERVEKAKLKYQKLCKEQGEEMEEHMYIHFNGIIKIINNLLKELVGEDKWKSDC